MTDLDHTLAAMQAHRWEIVRLRGKKPIGVHWQITRDPAEVARWVAGGDNIGLVCHQRAGVAVLRGTRHELRSRRALRDRILGGGRRSGNDEMAHGIQRGSEFPFPAQLRLWRRAKDSDEV
jgi:hypothetical protein